MGEQDFNNVLKNVDISDLSYNVKKELSVLGPSNREIVSKFLILAMEEFEQNNIKKSVKWIEQAVLRAGRVGYVRKIAGVLYYNNLNYKNAIKELSTANRLLEKNDLTYMIADSYRAIGEIDKANNILKNEIDNNFNQYDKQEKVELLIVYASIKRELKEYKMAELIIKNALQIAKGNNELTNRINESL